jgi:hypothetical protein
MCYYFFVTPNIETILFPIPKKKLVVSAWMLLNNGVATEYLATDAVFLSTSYALIIITAEGG